MCMQNVALCDTYPVNEVQNAALGLKQGPFYVFISKEYIIGR